MQIEYLREFLVLEKTLNLGKAAKILHISQSALSKHISALEDEFELDLFKRVGKTLQLTEAGAAFRDGATIIVNDVNNFTRSMRSIRDRSGATIEIAYLPAVASFLVGPIYDWFSKHAPDTHPRLLSTSASEISAGMLDKSISYAITLDFGDLDDQCSSMPIYDEEFLLVLSPRHRLAEKDRVTRADLINEEFMLPGAGFPRFASKLDAAFGMLPSYRKGTPHNDDVRTTLDLVAAGRGIAIAGSHNRATHPHLVFRRLDDLDEPITIPVSLFWQTQYETVRVITPHIAQLKAAIAAIRKS